MRTLRLAALLVATSATPGFCVGYDDLSAGITAINRGQSADAINFFTKALAANDLVSTQIYIAYLDRGIAYGAIGQTEKAIADLTAAIDLNPQDTAARLYRCQRYVSGGKLDAALQDIDAVIAVEPGDPRHYVSRALIYEMQGDTTRALQDFQTAQARKSDFKALRFYLGIAQWQAGQLDAAGASFEAGLDEWPGYAWLWLAMVDIKKGEPIRSWLPPKLDKTKWPWPIIAFFQGRLNEQELITDSVRTRADQMCQANFYLGEWHLLHGDNPGGKSSIAEAARTCARNSTEWLAALVEQKKLDAEAR